MAKEAKTTGNSESSAAGGEGSSRASAAYTRLFEAIRRGDLKPGTRIKEVELASMLGISRTPVREAVRRLETDGLIVHEPRMGMMVKQLTKREIIELYEMRAVLEGAAARMAAQHASGAEIQELDELNIAMREAQGDEHLVADANRDFHLSLYHAAKNPFLLKAITALNNSLAVQGGTTTNAKDRNQEAYDEHQAIIEAIRARDGAAAQRAAEIHMESAQQIRMRMLRENPPEDPYLATAEPED